MDDFLLQRQKGCAQLMTGRHGNTSEIIGRSVQTRLRGIQQEVATRTYQASNHLRNASLYVLRGQRSGREYNVPHTRRRWQASSPGEAPAMRTGMFRLSWRPQMRVEKKGRTYRCVALIESGLRVGKWLLGELLEDGTKRMKPRPYKQAVKDRAMPQIKALYRKSYKA